MPAPRPWWSDYGGQFPADEEALRALPGIGAYTSAAIASIAFDRRAIVVDGNVERVIARLFTVEEPLPRAKPEIKALAETLTPHGAARRFRPGDDGSRRDDLHARRARPAGSARWREPCRGRIEGTAEDVPAQGEEGRGQAAPRGGLPR